LQNHEKSLPKIYHINGKLNKKWKILSKSIQIRFKSNNAKCKFSPPKKMTSLQKDKSTTYKIPAELRPHCPLQQPTQTNYIKNRQALKYWWPAPLPRGEGQTHIQHFTHFPINTQSRRNILSYCSKYII